MVRNVCLWGIATFAFLPAAARGDPAKDYGFCPIEGSGRSTSYEPTGVVRGSAPGGAGAATLPLENIVPAAGHAEEGGADFAVPGSTVFYQMIIDPGTEVLDVRVAMQTGDADIFAGSVLSRYPLDYPFTSITAGPATEQVLVTRNTRPSIDSFRTWYLAVHGFLETDFICLAGWGRPGDPEPLRNGVPVTDRITGGGTMIVFPGSTKYYSCSLRGRVTSLKLTLAGMDGDADLFVGRILSADPTNYDFLSYRERADETIEVTTQTTPTVNAADEWFVVVHGFQDTSFTLTATWTGEKPDPAFLRGDCNDDRKFDITDAVTQLAVLFLGIPEPPCPAACDANGDGMNDISDPVAVLNRLFLGGPPPPAPFPDCGVPESQRIRCPSSRCG
jgi:hypothetical protein